MLQRAPRRRRGRAAASRRCPAPLLCQRKPATTQSAVRACLTLIIARLPGWYVPSAGFAITPSRPAPSKRSQPLGRDRAIARHRREVDRRRRRRRAAARAGPRRSLLRRDTQIAAVDGEQIEADERRRRLLRPAWRRARPPDAAAAAARRSRARAACAITISPSMTQPAGSRSRNSVVQLGKVAIERPQIAALDEDVGRRCGRRSRGSRPTSARRESRRRWAAASASFASIGSIGGASGPGVVPRPPWFIVAMHRSRRSGLALLDLDVVQANRLARVVLELDRLRFLVVGDLGRDRGFALARAVGFEPDSMSVNG